MAFITFLYVIFPVIGLSLLDVHTLCSDFVTAHSYKYENLICWSIYFRLFKFFENVCFNMDQDKYQSFAPLQTIRLQQNSHDVVPRPAS